MRKMKRDIVIMTRVVVATVVMVVVATVVMKNHESRKWRPNSPKEKRRKLRCYLCNGSHMKRDCRKVSSVSAIKRNDEPKETKPIEKKTSRVNSMVLIPKKMNGGEGLIFVDINIASQKRVLSLIREHRTFSYKKRLWGNLASRLRNRIGRLRQ
ncbi:hypothetical protein Golax_005773 [Gossypium laxum]|uniref:Uncharacterized protein n=1 Tax=Gossypium laxum TaxID=34288 RepID=A0A7J9A1U1_9ROSI|nr:hypothetical protein [Gossypium laxum]